MSKEEDVAGCLLSFVPFKNEVNLLSKRIVPQKLYLEKRHLSLLKAEIEILRSQGTDIRNMSQLIRKILDNKFQLNGNGKKKKVGDSGDN